MATIRLQSSDGDSFKVDMEVVKEFVTLMTMLEDLGIADGPNEEEGVVPLPNVTSKVLKKVIEWATHHKGNPVVIKEEDKIDWSGLEWDRDFLEQVCLLKQPFSIIPDQRKLSQKRNVSGDDFAVSNCHFRSLMVDKNGPNK